MTLPKTKPRGGERERRRKMKIKRAKSDGARKQIDKDKMPLNREALCIEDLWWLIVEMNEIHLRSWSIPIDSRIRRSKSKSCTLEVRLKTKIENWKCGACAQKGQVKRMPRSELRDRCMRRLKNGSFNRSRELRLKSVERSIRVWAEDERTV